MGVAQHNDCLSRQFDVGQFEPAERSHTAIEIFSAVDEIVPKRDESLYTKKESENNDHTILRIVKPESFCEKIISLL